MGKNIGKNESPALMEPMLPREGRGKLEDLALDLVEQASRLAGLINPTVQESVGDLVRSMNCYYSNLIEGHDTHPRDIEAALARDYSSEPKKRNLQKEAKAHINVQKKIDKSSVPENFISSDYICWIHREFCSHLPKEMLWVENPDTKEKMEVIPGELRAKTVVVGRHLSPRPENLQKFLRRFEEAYRLTQLSKVKKIIAVAASHHRLLWIHPFLDGNGRVTRLFSHAFFKYLGLRSSLWSAARGLARNVPQYRSHLEAADELRKGDIDGRGSLSSKALDQFCEFFLKICIDQISYMHSLLDPAELLNRIQVYSDEEERTGRLPKKSFILLREALILGEFERGKASQLTNYGQRQARTVLNSLVKLGLLKSSTPKGPVRLGFPIEVVERWFPKLYPGL
jgi:Fic family protein